MPNFTLGLKEIRMKNKRKQTKESVRDIKTRTNFTKSDSALMFDTLIFIWGHELPVRANCRADVAEVDRMLICG